MLFIPLIAEGMGASRIETGAIVAVYGLMSLISFYIFGWVSDKRGREALIKGGMLLSALTFMMQVFAYDEITLFMVRALCGFSIGVFYSSLVIYGVESGKKLGKYTAFESLGWGAGNLIAGIVAVYARVFTLSSVFFFISFLIALRLPEVNSRKLKVPLMPYKIIKKNLNVYLPFLMRDIGAYSIWAFLPIYFVGLGASSTWIGILYFINTGTQFLLKQFVDRIDYARLFRWGLILSAVTFYSYVFPTHYLHAIPIQVTLAAAWSALSIGAMGLLTARNAEKATVIGLFSSARSTARIIGPIAAGVITQLWGFDQLMMFSGTLTLAGLTVHLIKKKR